jgi:hypothetical protein
MAILAESGGSGAKLTAAQIAAQVAAEKVRAEAAQTNAAARRSTEAYASPFSTAFGGTAPSTAIDAVRQYASPFSTAFGGTAAATPYTPSQMVGPTGTYTGSAAAPVSTPAVTPTPTTVVNPPPPPVVVKPVVSAFDAASDAILAQTLTSYGLEGVAQTIAKIRGEYPEISSENLLLLLKNDSRYNAEYLKRFAGNAKLKAAGLPTMADSDYLKAEDEYKKIFTAYGATSLATRDYYATLIGNRMDAVDVTDRMNLAYARLQATPEVKKAFQTFYSAVSDGDILAAILDPTTQLPILQKKVAAAEIGGAALKQNLETSLATATELQGLGVTQAQAQTGYATIAQSLPSYEKLLEMRTGGDVKKSDAQALLEESTLKKNAKAIEAQRVTVEEELNRFASRAGNLGSKSFASQQRGAGLI